LQRDIGNRADKRDQADEGGDAFTLAVASRDKVGDGGNVLHLRHPDDPGNEGIAQADDEDRADIDGEEVEAGMAGKPHRSEEGPGRAIDGQRKGRDGGTGWTLNEAPPSGVAPMGHGEQEAEINQRRQHDGPGGNHRLQPSQANVKQL
jgi:hypothetical protein